MLLELDQDLLFCADERETTSVPTFYFVKKNLHCKKIILVDFSDTEVYMKAFINGESGRS